MDTVIFTFSFQDDDDGTTEVISFGGGNEGGRGRHALDDDGEDDSSVPLTARRPSVEISSETYNSSFSSPKGK